MSVRDMPTHKKEIVYVRRGRATGVPDLVREMLEEDSEEASVID
jgi:hypothetical protein